MLLVFVYNACFSAAVILDFVPEFQATQEGFFSSSPISFIRPINIP